MKGYLTYNRVENLLVNYLFNNEWDTNTLDYTKEKYYRIFNSLPDKIEVVNDQLILPNYFGNVRPKMFYRKG